MAVDLARSAWVALDVVNLRKAISSVTSNVLVLDAAQRSALAATRSLGRLGLAVTTADATPRALAGCSRYSSDYLHSPSSELEPQAYITWLAHVLRSEQFEWVLPVTEITSQLILLHREELPDVSLPFADYDTVMKLADKGKLVELATQLGVSCPASKWYASASELEKEALTFPLVLKPCLSKIFTGECWLATRVRVLSCRADLEQEFLDSPYLQDYPFMLQEFVPGSGAGIFCLYERGRPAAFFAHRRLREKPPEGGVSVLSESAPVDPALRECAERLLSAVQWHGVAMVEFRVTPEGHPYLMEVNTRFWGSLQLAIDAGVDFPRLLWQIDRCQAMEVVEGYRVGQRLRWLLGDLDGLYLYMRGRYTSRQKLARLRQFFTPRMRHCRHEVNRLGDLGPGWHELKLYLKQLRGR